MAIKTCKALLSLVLWYLPVLFVQVISARVTINSIGPWYDHLQKASWNPPPWVFGPVWTLLYLMMAVAAWLVHRTAPPSKLRLTAFTCFFLQLALNGLWSFLFFGWQLPGFALLDLSALLIMATVTTYLFFSLNTSAALLMVPYLLWLFYALTLNGAIWLMA